MILRYSRDVIASYWQKQSDGTLHAVDRFSKSGHRLADYLSKADGGYITITTGDIHTKSLDEYSVMINDDERYAKLEKDKFDPCFRPIPDFEPFQHVDPHYDLFADEGDNRIDVEGFREGFMSPAYMHRLRLAEIEHRFPGGLEGHLGDKDVRDRLSAQSYVFHFNYKHLNDLRRHTVCKSMFGALGVFSAAGGLLTAIAVTPPKTFGVALSTFASNHSGSAADLVKALTQPDMLMAGGVLLTVGAAWLGGRIANAVARHFCDIHRGMFESFTSTSCARVSKAVTSRQDNLHYLQRSMMEEIDRTREAAWAQGYMPGWAQKTRRWIKTVFWLHERMLATEENMSTNMKIIGLHYSGLRACARIKALSDAGRFYTLGFVLALALLAAFVLKGNPAADLRTAYLLMGGLGLTVLYGLRIHALHNLIKALEEPQSIQVVINLASTTYTKGYKDSALHEVIASYMEREKQKMLMEEEKLRGK